MRDEFLHTALHHGGKKGKSASFDLKLVDVIMFLSPVSNKLAYKSSAKKEKWPKRIESHKKNAYKCIKPFNGFISKKV